MTEVSHQALSQHLSGIGSGGFSPVYLIHGEPYLCRKACQTLIHSLVPDSKEREQSVTVIELGEPGQVAELLEQLNTYSFFSSRRVVVLRNALVFNVSRSRGGMVEKVKKAYDGNNMDKAAEIFLRILAQAHLALEDANAGTLAEALDLKAPGEQGGGQDTDWMAGLAAYCINQGLCVPQAADDTALLQQAIKRGFPKAHYLVITS